MDMFYVMYLMIVGTVVLFLFGWWVDSVDDKQWKVRQQAIRDAKNENQDAWARVIGSYTDEQGRRYVSHPGYSKAGNELLQKMQSLDEASL